MTSHKDDNFISISIYIYIIRLTCASLCSFPDSTCVSECPAGTYSTRQEADGAELGFCLPCDHICSTCNGASPKDCLTCSQGYLRLLQLCVTHCPTGYKAESSIIILIVFTLYWNLSSVVWWLLRHPLFTDIRLTEYAWLVELSYLQKVTSIQFCHDFFSSILSCSLLKQKRMCFGFLIRF